MAIRQDIIIAGVGGQGILTVAGVIASAAVDMALHVKQSEVHGMAQRGGAVVSHLRLSTAEIASDLIPLGGAHMILSMEPMESLRYLSFARKDAWLITNQNPLKNVVVYPDMGKILAHVRAWPKHVLIDAEKLAKESGASRTANSVMLGAASIALAIPFANLRVKIEQIFSRKGEEVVNKTLRAFDLGRQAAMDAGAQS